ncbi:MAG: hypothetical protein ACPGUD_05820 [Parashewanella sp.]
MTEPVDRNATSLPPKESTSAIVEPETLCVGERHYTAHEEISAKVIQRCFKKFLAFKSSLTPNEYGFKKYKTAKRVSYYFCGEGKLPYLVRPVYKSRVHYAGSEKWLERQSDRFVLLRPVANSHTKSFTIDSAKRLIHLGKLLVDCRFIYPQFVVEKDVILSRNGGESLLKGYILQNHIIKLSQFKGVCSDLALLHQKELVVRDVNAGNFVVKLGEKSPVCLIDLDAMVTKVELAGQSSAKLTGKYSTSELLNAQYRHDFELTKRGDQYGFLMVMCESTCLELAEVVEQHKGLTKGVLNEHNRQKFKNWAEKYVKPKYVEEILAFLKCPEAKALSQPLHLMFNWDD